MKNAKLSVIAFNDNDVIATSGAITVTWAGLYDGIPDNATLTYKGVDYLGKTGRTLTDLNTSLSSTGVQISGNTYFLIFDTTTVPTTMTWRNYDSLISYDGVNWENYYKADNGTYTWDPNNECFSNSTN